MCPGGLDRPDYARLDDPQLARRQRAGDARARTVLIERHLPLAWSCARRYGRRKDALAEDLDQVAALGLVKAVERWEPERGFALSSFAVPTILGELRRFLRDTTWAVRPPRDLMELAWSVRRARDRVGDTTAREPTPEELAEHLGRSTQDVLEAMQAAQGRTARALHAPRSDAGVDGLAVEEAVGDLDDGYARVEARDEIASLTSALSHHSRRIVQMRFEDDLLQEQIAQRVGISRAHVSRTLSASLESLKRRASYARQAA
jgi:RNA polymerase sigma-B factor